VTVECGCNQVVGNQPGAIRASLLGALTKDRKTIRTPELWDGSTAWRIVDVLKKFEFRKEQARP
jgi:UDP-N-acetylglucosamine 2-epimerase (non-hydrolysing)